MNNLKSYYDTLAQQNHPIPNTTLSVERNDTIVKKGILSGFSENITNFSDLLTPGNCSAKPSLLPSDNPDQKCTD